MKAQKKKRVTSLPFLNRADWILRLEADTEGHREIVAVHAVLRKYVKAIQVLIPEGETSRRVEGVNKARFGIELGAGEVAEFVGETDTTVETESVAGVAIEVLVDGELKAIAKKVAFLTKCGCRKSRGLVIETSATDYISTLVIGVVEVIDRIKRKGPYVAGATDLGERISILILEKERRPVVDGQKIIEGRSLDAEVVPVELRHDPEFLVEVAATAGLDVDRKSVV